MDEKDEPVVVKLKHVSQPHAHSILEVIVHMVVGFLITMLVLYIAFPEIPLLTNLHAAGAVTLIKFVANYFIRRYFTGRSHALVTDEDPADE